jgi:hypothetical protein
MQDFSSLGIELLNFGFHPVVFLECECPEHGTFRFRVMPEQAIDDRIACPTCNVLRPCSGILAAGYTRKTLLALEPEHVYRSARWEWIREEQYRPRHMVGGGRRSGEIAPRNEALV